MPRLGYTYAHVPFCTWKEGASCVFKCLFSLPFAGEHISVLVDYRDSSLAVRLARILCSILIYRSSAQGIWLDASCSQSASTSTLFSACLCARLVTLGTEASRRGGWERSPDTGHSHCSYFHIHPSAPSIGVKHCHLFYLCLSKTLFLFEVLLILIILGNEFMNSIHSPFYINICCFHALTLLL